MKKYWLIGLLALTLGTGCIKEPDVVTGCNDPSALNYNIDADPGDVALCAYLVDYYIGGYFTVEQIDITNSSTGATTSTSDSYKFTIERLENPDKALVLGFYNCSDSLIGTCTAASTTINNGSNCNLPIVSLSRDGNVLNYQFSYTQGFETYSVDGAAVKN